MLKEAEALRSGNFEEFKRLVTESGHSSLCIIKMYLLLKMWRSRRFTCACGDRRAAGGTRGRSEFMRRIAGTMQAFVPNDMLEEYKSEIEKIFGEGHCYVLSVRPVGGAKIG